MKKTILFDLDGTLTDPVIGITNSVIYALKRYGISVSDRKQLYPFIGPPLKESFMKYYGFSGEQAIEAIGIYREYFEDKGKFENEVYPGIPQLLAQLQAAGMRLAVATSKPQPVSIEIIGHFGLAPYFESVFGSNMDHTRTEKVEVIEFALQELKAFDLQQVIMVGDRKYDILGAKQCGIHSVGVLYGYGSQAELQAAGADRIVGTVSELGDCLIKELK